MLPLFQRYSHSWKLVRISIPYHSHQSRVVFVRVDHENSWKLNGPLPVWLFKRKLNDIFFDWMSVQLARIIWITWESCKDTIAGLQKAIWQSQSCNYSVKDIQYRCAWFSYMLGHKLLCDCRQRVNIGSTTWKLSHLKDGVPHNTLLGPMAFLMHINNLQIVCPTIK